MALTPAEQALVTQIHDLNVEMATAAAAFDRVKMQELAVQMQKDIQELTQLLLHP